MGNNTAKTYKSKSCVVLWLWSIGAIVTGVLIAFGILIWYTPKAYQPLQPDNPEQVSLYLTHQLGPDFFNQIQLDQPFELIIEQAGLNDIFSRWPWPEQFGAMSFSDPILTFSNGSIILMANLEIKQVPSVLTVTCFPTMDPDGDICMNVQSIQLGLVPVTPLISTLAQNAFDNNRDFFEGDPEAAAVVEAIIRNESFEPVFKTSDYKVRISHFSVDQGVLSLTLQPES
jgi:hypothetical protein